MLPQPRPPMPTPPKSIFRTIRHPKGEDKEDLPVFCLCELSVRRQAQEQGQGQEWELSVNVKCTQKRHATGFVAELSLGNLFELL